MAAQATSRATDHRSLRRTESGQVSSPLDSQQAQQIHGHLLVLKDSLDWASGPPGCLVLVWVLRLQLGKLQNTSLRNSTQTSPKAAQMCLLQVTFPIRACKSLHRAYRTPFQASPGLL